MVRSITVRRRRSTKNSCRMTLLNRLPANRSSGIREPKCRRLMEAGPSYSLPCTPIRPNCLMRQADSVEVPSCVWQPLFRPAPVVVFARDSIAQVEGDAVFVVDGSGDAVDDGARSAGVLVGAEKQIRGVAVAASHKHACIKGVAAMDPVKLVPSVGLELGLEGRITGEEWRGQARRAGQRGETCILTLPPGSGCSVMRKEEGATDTAI